MTAVAIPPFERFYEEHRNDVLRLFRRRLGVDRADDAFQETFLRALRAYGRLEHGEHLRAWVLTIAQNVALDVLRRTRPTEGSPRPHRRTPDPRRLADLTDGLGPKERVRSCSATATTCRTTRSRRRSAPARTLHDRPRLPAFDASEGGSTHDRLPRPRPALPRGSLDLGLIDIGYDLVESPIGEPRRYRSRRRLDLVRPRPGRGPRAARLHRGPRSPLPRSVDRAPRARRVLRRPATHLRPRPRPRARLPFTREVLGSSPRAFPTARRRRTARWRSGSATLGPRAVGTGDERNRIPIVLPCHRVVGANGSLTGYAGGLDRKETLLELEGARS